MSLAYKAMMEKARKAGKKPMSARDFCVVKCPLSEKRTKESEADACDVNQIMARYINTGRLPEYIKENPQFGDFADAKDYHASMNVVVKAQEQFALLPSKVREKCQNDPAKFLEFVSDPKNRDELVEMRLASPRMEQGVELAPSAISKLAESISGAIGGPKASPAPSSQPTAPKEGKKEGGAS